MAAWQHLTDFVIWFLTLIFLDLVLTDNAENITDLTVHPPEYQCTPSDHYLIIFRTSFEHNTTQSTIRVVFDFAKGDGL